MVEDLLVCFAEKCVVSVGLWVKIGVLFASFLKLFIAFVCLRCCPPSYRNNLFSFMCHVSQHLLVFSMWGNWVICGGPVGCPSVCLRLTFKSLYIITCDRNVVGNTTGEVLKHFIILLFHMVLSVK